MLSPLSHHSVTSDIIVSHRWNKTCKPDGSARRRIGNSILERLFRMPGMAEHLVREHRNIYQAIVRQDPEAAEQRMYEHLTGVEDFLRGYEKEASL
ncbi:MAG: FCD domain-containing protein [Alicyclobacillaceae bacterium]|nr:FCD domain-containing protein [Alicyclobacillaceae bacterium]